MAVAIINKKKLLEPCHIRVRSAPEDGEVVVIRLGDQELGLHFEDAFRLSGIIARQARTAMARKIAATGRAV